MKSLFGLVKFIIRLIVVWFVDTISLIITASVYSGITISAVGDVSRLGVATAAAFLLGIINFLIRPFLLLVALPLGSAAVFLAGFVINAAVLMLTARLLPGFEVADFWAAFLGGLIISVVNTILTSLMEIDDDDSVYQHLIERQALRRAGKIEIGEGRGLVILETDGLSYQRIQKAIADGYMPTLSGMIENEGYHLSLVDCGVPPTTPACQAGILQGNNLNIPAFRWLDKKTGRVLAGGGAAAEVEPLLSDGNGLLRGGSSIGNMFSGDAAKSILTFSKLKSGTPEDKKRRAEDIYLLMRNPYFFTRVLVLVFGDIFQEIWQGWQQRRKKVEPRLNRLHNGYPFLRAAVNVFLREIGTYFTILDIIRGVPAMYTLYAGYDEIAHHSGPYTHDADLSLRQFDKQVGRVKRAIENKARRPYELLLLSDHGQSFGHTFKQRYGQSILEFIEEKLPQGTSLAGSGGGDDGTLGVAAMMDELQNIQDQKQGGRMSKAVLNQAQRGMQNTLDKQVSFQETQPAKVTLAYGGNGAQVYFDLFPRKVTLNELNAAYPGMVDAIVAHEGIGFVIAFEDDLTPVAFGKQGARNLHTGELVGIDPLAPYGNVELRTWQLGRMADFDNGGDLTLNSTLYPDGTVAALEELIGNHGGLGGEQTDAYLFHPGDMVVPETRNSYEFKAILDSRRGLPGTAPKPPQPAEAQVDSWAIGALAKGLGRVGAWLNYALHTLTFNRENYRQLARDVYMNAPALLIALLGTIAQSYNQTKVLDWQDILIRYGVWLAAIVALSLVVRLLRGKAPHSATLRAAGFAQTVHIFELLGFLPVIGSVLRPLAMLLGLFGVWIGVSTAQELKGWRSLILPVVYIFVLITTVVFLYSIVQGVALTVDSLAAEIGWTPK